MSQIKDYIESIITSINNFSDMCEIVNHPNGETGFWFEDNRTLINIQNKLEFISSKFTKPTLAEKALRTSYIHSYNISNRQLELMKFIDDAGYGFLITNFIIKETGVTND